MKKVTLKVERREYDLNLKDEIAHFIMTHLSNDFHDRENLKVKELLVAYIRKSIELKEAEDKLALLKKEIEDI
jgi:hypothetical protein